MTAPTLLRRAIDGLTQRPRFEQLMTREEFTREWVKERTRQYRWRMQPNRVKGGWVPSDWPTAASERYDQETSALLALLAADPESVHALAAEQGVTIRRPVSTT